ncbi:MAG: DUF2628 domain-containing protein [Mycobacterium sp.]|jgi:hypothetical protein|nr:DUF2628 domain-containing protein [Mycobacterium sp.]
MTNPPIYSAELPEIWQRRFAFFDAYGQPNSSPEARAAFRALPFGTRMRLNSNFLAFLFGPIYFFVKGMWRKGLSLLAIGLAIGVLLSGVETSNGIVRGLSLVDPLIAMLTANYAYYLHVVHHSVSWNPFEGMGRRKTDAPRFDPSA